MDQNEKPVTSSTSAPRAKKSPAFFNKISLFIKKHPRRFKKILALIGLIVLSVFFVFASIGFIAYYNYADSALVDTLVKVFPYPAATVNGHVITLQEWQNKYAIWKAVNDKSQQSTDSQLREDVLNSMVNEVLINDLAKKYNIEVTDADIDTEMAALAENVGSQEDLDAQIQLMYGWTREEFIDRVYRVFILNNKLGEQISQNEKIVKAAEKRARPIQEQAANGADFAQLAIENSDDLGSKQSGGDLDWFGRGMMVTEFEDAAFALEVGQVSDLVKTQYGFHIIKVEEKQPADPEKNQEEKVHARHILIKFQTYEDIMNDVLKKAKIWRFINL